jgi:Cof subfamily protein (haloacid dehalogenase superfamily)
VSLLSEIKMNSNDDQKAPIVRMESTRIRLLVLDIDGTIADDSEHIREAVALSIRSAQRRGVQVAIATGRGFQLSLPAYDFIGSTLPLICYEGALIKEPKTGLVHRHWSLARRVIAQVLDHTEQLSLSGRVSVHFYAEDKLFVSNLSSATVRYFEGSQIEPVLVRDLRSMLNRSITKVRVLSDDSRVITRLSSKLKNAHSRAELREYRSLEFLELTHHAVSKRLAVGYLAEHVMGLRPENVMAVGDYFTDIEMLRYAGIGVAMGNAPGAVKAAADWVTTTLEKDGVSRAIERWILRANGSSTSLPARRESSSSMVTLSRSRDRWVQPGGKPATD